MMSQTNIEHLFQMTAPLPERGATSSESQHDDWPAFDDHLAEASATAHGTASPKTHLRESLSTDQQPDDPRPAADIDSEETNSPESDSQLQEYAACEAPGGPKGCRSPEPDTFDDEVQANEAAATESVDKPVSGADEVVSRTGESDADDDQHLDAAAVDGSLVTEAITSPLLTDLARIDDKNSDGDTNILNATEPDANTQRDEQGQPHVPSTPKSATRIVATDIGTNAVNIGQTSVAIKQASQAEQSLIAATQAVIDEAAVVAEANRDTSATSTLDTRTTKGSKKRAVRTEGDAESAEGVPKDNNMVTGQSEKATPTARKSSEKAKSADDSRQRSSGNTDSRMDLRVETTTTATANKSDATMVSGIPATTHGSTTKTNSDKEAGRKPSAAVAAKSEALFQSVMRSHGTHRANRRSGADAPDATPRVDAARFVGRVSKAIQTAQERGGALQLRLSPPELGSLRLELNVENGVMTAALETESPVARQVLLDHLPSLRERLAEQNIRIERFDVDVRQDGSGGQADARASQHEHREQQPQHSTPRQAPGLAHDGEDVTHELTAIRERITMNGINVLA